MSQQEITKSIVLSKISKFICRKGIIDEIFYLKKYPDVLINNFPASDHYTHYGQYENRRPSKNSQKYDKCIPIPGLNLSINKVIMDEFSFISEHEYSEYIDDCAVKNISSKRLLKPLVSVILTSCNQDKFIIQALQSIYDQDYENIELIIVDDASSDKSVEQISEFIKNSHKKLKNLIFIKNRKRIGLSGALLKAKAKARGKFIAFLEHDDVWDKKNISSKIKTLNKFSFAKFIVGFTEPFGEHNNIDAKREYIAISRARLCESVNFLSQEELFELNYIPTFSTVLIQSEIFNKLDFSINHQKLDWYLWAQILRLEPVVVSPTSKVFWRQHQKSLSSDLNLHLATRGTFKSSLANLLLVPVTDKQDQNLICIQKSNHFDRIWYALQSNLSKDIDPASHYLHVGWRLGLSPSPLFDGNKYLAFHDDVAKADVNPLLHYELHGKGRRLTATVKGAAGGAKILLISSTSLGGAVYEWRLRGLADRLGMGGSEIDIECINELSPDFLDKLHFAKIIIFNRPLINGVSGSILRVAKKNNALLVCDFDDLISNEKFFSNGRYLSGANKEVILKDTDNQTSAIYFFDAITVSTIALKNYFLSSYTKPIFLIKNKLLSENLNNKNIKKKIIESDDSFRIGVFSGSNTHNHDISTILLDLLVAKHTFNFSLTIVGQSSMLEEYLPKLEANHIKSLNFKNMLKFMSEFDLIIVPLDFNEFNLCKSNIRYIEAGSVGVPILAPNHGEYKNSITHGINGYLYNDEHFLEALSEILKNTSALRKVGRSAKMDISKNFNTKIFSDDDLIFSKYISVNL